MSASRQQQGRTGGRAWRTPDVRPFFDASWYLDCNPDVAAAQVDPLQHFMEFGAAERRKPHPLFDISWYVETYADALRAGENPLADFVRHGDKRNPNPLFDSAWYRETYSDVAASGEAPFAHFLRVGARAARSPHPLFDAAWYLRNNPDVAKSEDDALTHYLNFGGVEGRDPHPLFNARTYLRCCPDAAGSNLLMHFLRHGATEGASPHALFDAGYYFETYRHLLVPGENPLVHFIRYGATLRTNPNAEFDTAFYLDRYPEVLTSSSNPLVHYVSVGAQWDRPCHPAWDPTDHRRQYPELCASAILPLAHRLKMKSRQTGQAGSAFPSDELAPPLRETIPAGGRDTAVAIVRTIFAAWDEDEKQEAPTDLALTPSVVELARKAAELAGNRSLDAACYATIVISSGGNAVATICALYAVLSTVNRAGVEIIVAVDEKAVGCAAVVASLGGIVRLVASEDEGDARRLRNTAAAFARGRVLVFLEDNAIVLPGWLDALLAQIDGDTTIGCVGSKLIDRDGRLREAGLMVAADGSVSAYGADGDPRAPQFNAVRDVDALSMNAMAVATSVFADLGGFAAAYAADRFVALDFAYRVRAAGLRVVCEPLSTALAVDSLVPAADRERAEADRKTFLERWGNALVAPPMKSVPAWLFARDRSQRRPRILIVDRHVPQPDRDAGSRSMDDYIRLFVDAGFQVTFWPDNQLFDPVYAPRLQRRGVEVLYDWDDHVASLDTWLDICGAALDYAFISRPDVAHRVIGRIRKKTKAKLLFYGHDLHYKRLEREYATTGNQDTKADMINCERWERVTWAASDAVYYLSDEECQLVRELAPKAHARTIPLFIYPQRQLDETRARLLSEGVPGRNTVIFVGGFRHQPNVDAILWFMKNVWHLVVDCIPTARLEIVGSDPPDILRSFVGEQVELTGHVTDAELARRYRAASAAVVPLRYGAGLKGKMFEAIRHGIPLVSTSIGAEGVGPAVDFMDVCDEPNAFAENVIACLVRPRIGRLLTGLDYLAVKMSKHAALAALQADVPELK